MSLIFRILEELWNSELNYKGVRVNIFGIPKLASENKELISANIYRLKKQGFISKNSYGHRITFEGRKHFERKCDSLKNFSRSCAITYKSKKDLLVVYDIPEKQKAERDWFRFHLKKFGFEMVQRSVWIGPSPLPKEFMDYIKKIGLKSTFKTFKLIS